MKTFSEAFSAILKKRKMSLSAASSALGFSSKTALFRILGEESKPRSIRKCLDAAKASPELALTQEEIDELEKALEVSSIGKQAYAMKLAMRRILSQSGHIEDRQVVLRGQDGIDSLEALFELCRHAEKIVIFIFGRCTEEMVHILHAFSNRANVSRIHHLYLVSGHDPEGLFTFSSASDILFSPVYMPHMISQEQLTHGEWIFKSGMISLCMEKAGKKETYLLTPMKDGGYYLLYDPSGNMNHFWTNIISDANPPIFAKKVDPSSQIKGCFLEKYAQFTEQYRQIENNREIYIMKPDIPFFCIDAQLLYPKMLQGIERANLKETATNSALNLFYIHQARNQNLFEKKKDTHIILNREAMREFARTGRRRDHFFIISSYTPQERVQILQQLLDQMKTNPNFHIWFSRDEKMVMDKEITAYEGYGIVMVRSDTSWALEKDHQEIILQSRRLASALREFLLSDVIEKETYPRARNIAIMEQLIALAQKS